MINFFNGKTSVIYNFFKRELSMKKNIKISLLLLCIVTFLLSFFSGFYLLFAQKGLAEEVYFTKISSDYDNEISSMSPVDLCDGETLVIEMAFKDVITLPDGIGFSIYTGDASDRVSVSTDGQSVSLKYADGITKNVDSSVVAIEDIINPKYDIKAEFSALDGEYSFALYRKGRDYAKDYLAIWQTNLSDIPLDFVYFSFDIYGESDFSVYDDIKFYKTNKVGKQLDYSIVGYDYSEYKKFNDTAVVNYSSEKENAIASEFVYNISDKVAEISFDVVSQNVGDYVGFVLSENGDVVSYAGNTDVFVQYTAQGTTVYVGNIQFTANISNDLVLADFFADGNSVKGAFDCVNGTFSLYKNNEIVQTISGLNIGLTQAKICLQLGANTTFTAQNFVIKYSVSGTETIAEEISSKYVYVKDSSMQTETELINIYMPKVFSGYVTSANTTNLTVAGSSIVMEFDLVGQYALGQLMGACIQWNGNNQGVNWMTANTDTLKGAHGFASGKTVRITLKKGELTFENKTTGSSSDFTVAKVQDLSSDTTIDWTDVRLGIQVANNTIFNFENFGVYFNNNVQELYFSPGFVDNAEITKVYKDTYYIVNAYASQTFNGYLTTKQYVDLTQKDSSIVMQFDMVGQYTWGLMMGVISHWGTPRPAAHYLYGTNIDNCFLGSYGFASGKTVRITMTQNKIVFETKAIGSNKFSLAHSTDLSSYTNYDWTNMRIGIQQSNNAVYNFENFCIYVNGKLSKLEIGGYYLTSEYATIEEVIPTVSYDNTLKNIKKLDVQTSVLSGVVANEKAFSLDDGKTATLTANLKSATDLSNLYLLLNNADSSSVSKTPLSSVLTSVALPVQISVTISAEELLVCANGSQIAKVAGDYSSVAFVGVEFEDATAQIENLKIACGDDLVLSATDSLLSSANITVYGKGASNISLSDGITCFEYEQSNVYQSNNNGYIVSDSLVFGDKSVYFEVEMKEFGQVTDISASGNNFGIGFSYGSNRLHSAQNNLSESYAGFSVMYYNFYTASSSDKLTAVTAAKEFSPNVYITNDISRDEIFFSGNTVRAVYSPKDGIYSLLVKKAGQTDFTLVQQIYGLNYNLPTGYVALQADKSMTLISDNVSCWVGNGLNASVNVDAKVKLTEYKGDGVSADSITLVTDTKTTVAGKGVDSILELNSASYDMSWIVTENVEYFGKYQKIIIDTDVEYYKQSSEYLTDVVDVGLTDDVKEFDVYATKKSVVGAHMTSDEYLYLVNDNSISFEMDIITSFTPTSAVWAAWCLGVSEEHTSYLYGNEGLWPLMYGKQINYLEKGYSIKVVATKDYLSVYRKKSVDAEYPEEPLYTYTPEEKGVEDFSKACRLGFEIGGSTAINMAFANVKIEFYDSTAKTTTEGTLWFSEKLANNIQKTRLSVDMKVGYKSEHLYGETEYGEAAIPGNDIVASGQFTQGQAWAMQGHFLRKDASVSIQFCKSDDLHFYDYYKVYTTLPDVAGDYRLHEINLLELADENASGYISAVGTLTFKNLNVYFLDDKQNVYFDYIHTTGSSFDSEDDNILIDVIVDYDENLGTVDGAGEYYVGSNVNLDATAAEGYIFEGYYLFPEGQEFDETIAKRYLLSESAYYSLDLSVDVCALDDVTIYAVFKPAVMLTLKIGTKATVVETIAGKEYTVYPECSNDTKFVGWKVNGVDVDKNLVNADNSLTFIMSDTAMTIEAITEQFNGNSSIQLKEENVNKKANDTKIAIMTSFGVAFIGAIAVIVFVKNKKKKV